MEIVNGKFAWSLNVLYNVSFVIWRSITSMKYSIAMNVTNQGSDTGFGA